MPRSTADERLAAIAPVLFDRMTEMVLFNRSTRSVSSHAAPKPLVRIQLTSSSRPTRAGLALSPDEISYLVTNFERLGREPPMSS